MIDFTELERLAKEAERMPWEANESDVPLDARLALAKACTADVILRLLAIRKAADEFVDARESMNSRVYQAAFAALRSALHPQPQKEQQK